MFPRVKRFDDAMKRYSRESSAACRDRKASQRTDSLVGAGSIKQANDGDSEVSALVQRVFLGTTSARQCYYGEREGERETGSRSRANEELRQFEKKKSD